MKRNIQGWWKYKGTGKSIKKKRESKDLAQVRESMYGLRFWGQGALRNGSRNQSEVISIVTGQHFKSILERLFRTVGFGLVQVDFGFDVYQQR